MTKSFDEISAGDLCHVGSADANAPVVVVWGDSHALALLPAYEVIAQKRGLRVHLGAWSSCRPLMHVDSRSRMSRSNSCVQFNAAMQSAVERLAPDLLILNAYWEWPDLDLMIHAGEPISFEAALQRTLRHVAGTSICAVHSVATLDAPVLYASAMSLRRGIEVESIVQRDSRVHPITASTDETLKSLAHRGLLLAVDPKRALCNESACQLRNHAGLPLYRDTNHLSPAGAVHVSNELARCFDQLPTGPASTSPFAH